MSIKSRLKKGSQALVLAVALIGGWEGVRTVAYKDIVGVPTVCFGETRGVKMGDKYTMEECKTMLGAALVEFETGMRKCLTAPDSIPEKSYVAFLSLAYNIGNGAFCKSSIARHANAGNLEAACNAIPLYNKAGGKVVRGLVNRRADEQRICLDGLRASPVSKAAIPEKPIIKEAQVNSDKSGLSGDDAFLYIALSILYFGGVFFVIVLIRKKII